MGDEQRKRGRPKKVLVPPTPETLTHNRLGEIERWLLSLRVQTELAEQDSEDFHASWIAVHEAWGGMLGLSFDAAVRQLVREELERLAPKLGTVPANELAQTFRDNVRPVIEELKRRRPTAGPRLRLVKSDPLAEDLTDEAIAVALKRTTTTGAKVRVLTRLLGSVGAAPASRLELDCEIRRWIAGANADKRERAMARNAREHRRAEQMREERERRHEEWRKQWGY